METDVVWMYLIVVVSVTSMVLVIYWLGVPPKNQDFAGIWQNESLNIRILLHDNNSTHYQGSVIWANGVDRLLGFMMVENLILDKSSKTAKGKYSDPLTGKVYEITLRMKRKGLILINAYHPNSTSLAFSQEWKQFTS